MPRPLAFGNGIAEHSPPTLLCQLSKSQSIFPPPKSLPLCCSGTASSPSLLCHPFRLAFHRSVVRKARRSQHRIRGSIAALAIARLRFQETASKRPQQRSGHRESGRVLSYATQRLLRGDVNVGDTHSCNTRGARHRANAFAATPACLSPRGIAHAETPTRKRPRENAHASRFTSHAETPTHRGSLCDVPEAPSLLQRIRNNSQTPAPPVTIQNGHHRQSGHVRAQNSPW